VRSKSAAFLQASRSSLEFLCGPLLPPSYSPRGAPTGTAYRDEPRGGYAERERQERERERDIPRGERGYERGTGESRETEREKVRTGEHGRSSFIGNVGEKLGQWMMLSSRLELEVSYSSQTAPTLMCAGLTDPHAHAGTHSSTYPSTTSGVAGRETYVHGGPGGFTGTSSSMRSEPVVTMQ
jgi:hypothetical protein